MYYMRTIVVKSDFWSRNNSVEWKNEEHKYYDLVHQKNQKIEHELNNLSNADIDRIAAMPVSEFYTFLHDKYFKWKYTAANRYNTTIKNLEKYQNDFSELEKIQKQLFSFNLDNAEEGLKIVTKIKGLGIAGGSGLLSILFPEYFGTVDQFVVKSLLYFDEFKNSDRIKSIKPESISLKNGVLLETILREKAKELDLNNNTHYWTPRKVDMVLWIYKRD